MKKIVCIFCLFLGIGHFASAQFLDSLAGLSAQGVLIQQSSRQLGQGMSALNQNQILQDLVQTVMQIRLTHMNGYTGVSTASVSGQPFKDISWSVGPKNSMQFYILLENINQSLCQKLVSSMTEAKEIEINHVVGNAQHCQTNNVLKFIFD